MCAVLCPRLSFRMLLAGVDLRRLRSRHLFGRKVKRKSCHSACQ